MNIAFGIAQNYIGDRISVITDSGQIVVAIPQGNITSRKVILFKDNLGRIYCRCDTEAIEIYRYEDISRLLPEEEEEEEVELLPFQVLTTDLLLGGDRSSIDLSESNIQFGGITNLGEQNYLATWYNPSNCNIITNSSTIANSISVFLLCPAPSDPIWYGFGSLGLHYNYYPDENLTIEETGQLLPPDLPENSRYRIFEKDLAVPQLGFYNFPDYPVFIERASAVREGSRVTSQIEDNYSLNIVEAWDYKHRRNGNNPTPGVLDIFAICNGSLAGLIENVGFSRETKANYTLDTTSTLNNPTQLWLNGNVFSGDRTETYSEQYSYNKSEALFTSNTAFVCNADPFNQFSPGFFSANSSDAEWSGETIAENRIYSSIIEEPSWEYPVSLSTNKARKELQTSNFELRTDYQVPSQTWQLQSSFPPGFNFEVEATETQSITRTQSTDRITPELLFLSITGNESFFVENKEVSSIDYSRERTRNINKLLYDYSTQFPEDTELNATTEINNNTINEIYFCDGNNEFALNLIDSFSFKITQQINLNIGGITLNNENDNAMDKFPIEIITHYLKTETKTPNTSLATEFQDVESTLNPTIAALNNRQVYILTYGKRAIATISSYEFSDEVNPDLAIETIRTINSITAIVDSVEDYPTGLVRQNEVLIYPTDNASALLKNELLTPGNKEFCNLVGSTLYYSKGVTSNLELTTQFTEVYPIVNGAIVQGNPEQGQFVPMSVDGKSVASVAYFPM